MENDFRGLRQDLANKLKEIVTNERQVILEIAPEYEVKIKIIDFVLNLIKNTQNKRLILCVKSIESLEKFSKSISDLNPNIPGLSLLSCMPLCKLESTPITPFAENTCSNSCFFDYFQYKSKFLEQGPILSTSGIVSFSKTFGVCPYFFVKKYFDDSKIILCTQSYYFKKAKEFLNSPHYKDIILFEESTDLDVSISDTQSSYLTLKILSSGFKGIEEISERIREEVSESSESFLKFYQNAKTGNFKDFACNDWQDSQVIGSVLLKDAEIPGNLRKPHHFLKALKTMLVYLRQFLRTKEANVQSACGFLYKLHSSTFIFPVTLSYFTLVFHALCNIFKIPLSKNISSLAWICDFCTNLAVSPENYSVIFEPYPIAHNILSPVLQLSLNNTSSFLAHALFPISTQIFITAACSPCDLFTKLLGLTCEVLPFAPASNFLCQILTRGSDQLFVSTKFEEKSDDGVMRNYGDLLLEISDIVPDGIVAFFPEWGVLEKYVIKWNESGVIYRLLENKTVMIESPQNEHQILQNFAKACVCGRGSVLLAVSRGKISRDLHLYGTYIKCTVMVGIPQPNILSRVLKARLSFLKEKFDVDESEYLNFDAVRQSFLCGSHSLRAGSKSSILVLADKRYEAAPKKNKFPQWVSENSKSLISSSTDMVKTSALKFLKNCNKNFR